MIQEQLERFKENPRHRFIRAVQEKDMTACLVKAAEIHGHFCPGVAMGVMASVCGLWELGAASVYFDGIMEDLMAVVEANACFADGVQAVTGCTLGNNALVFRDLGRLAVTLSRRGEQKGVRIRVAPTYRLLVEEGAPQFYPLMEKVIARRAGTAEDLAAFRQQARQAAFTLIEKPFDAVLIVESVRPELPQTAPIKPSAVCPKCGEEVMGTKIVAAGAAQGLCFTCGGHPFYEVEGQGIVQISKPCGPSSE